MYTYLYIYTYFLTVFCHFPIAVEIFSEKYFFYICTYRMRQLAWNGFWCQLLDAPNSSEAADIYFCLFILKTLRDIDNNVQ